MKTKEVFCFAVLVAAVLAFLNTGTLHAGETANATNHVVAEVHGEKITLADIEKFGKTSPNYTAFLSYPGGKRDILQEMILRKLLYLEGKALKIPQPEDNNPERYVWTVFDQMMPPKPEWNREKLKKFYDEHHDVFSTPLFVRVSTVRVYIKPGKEKEAKEKIIKAAELLKAGHPFEEVARKFSEDEFSRSRNGDLGFMPAPDIKPVPLRKMLTSMKKGEISRPVRMGNYYAIYKVTDIRKPVLEPFDEKFVEKEATKYLAKKAVEDIRAKLTKKWGVKYIDPAFKPESDS